MKITLVGGSKGTGARLAALAHAAGHDVTVVSRSADASAAGRTITGDATDPTVASEAVTGADAVVVTVGGAKGVRHQRTAVTTSVIEAMKEAGTRRLLVQSSLGAGDSTSQLPGLIGLITRVLLAKPLADHNEQEAAVERSGLDWTVVRPTGLTDKPATGTWRAFEVADQGRLGGTITRDDLAAYMLRLLEDDTTIGKAIGVSN